MNLIKTRKNRLHRLPVLAIICALLMSPMALFAQTGVIVKGTVADVNGPLTGVTVAVQGIAKGAVMTDIDGKYTITAPDNNAVLVFTYMGYETIKESINQRGTIDVVMVEDSYGLGEVVVVGYGTQRREAVTGSVASMRGDDLRAVQTGNVSTALAGRVAGVQMLQYNSKPGADMEFRIRGIRTLSADNAPLIVLDGIPFGGVIGDINPNDIKSMDILKDASATAIYGARGANGVIIITTNKGIKDQQPKVSYNAYFGLKTLYHRYPMMTGDELYKLRDLAKVYAENIGGGATKPTMGADEKQGVNTDWQDLMFQNSITQSHNIGVTGATKDGNYYIGAGYLSDKSLLPGQDYSRINLRASIDQNVGKYLSFGLTTNSNYNITNGQNLSLYNTIALSPLVDPFNTDGSRKAIVQSVADKYWAYTREAMNELGDEYVDNQRGFGTYNVIYGEVKIPEIGLSYRLNVGLDLRTVNRGQYRGVGVFSDTPTANSTASLSKSQYYKWSVEHLLTYEKYFDKHHLTANALYAAEQSHYDRSLVSAINMPSSHFQYWNIGQAPSGDITYNPKDQDYYERALTSAMFRVMYDFDSRYMFLASVRWDGSSVLAKGYKWITYPAFSAGWNIGKEEFMNDVNWLNSLKLRLGWGLTSNQAVSPYGTLGSLGTRPYNFGNQTGTGFYVESTPNPELGWEYSHTWNIGLDFSVLNNRLNGTMEYYITNTYDVLQRVNLPTTGGVSSYMANIGKMRNKGFELTLNGTIIDNKDGWSWEAGINFYTNKNEITELATGQERDEGNAWFVGYPVNSIFDYEKIGLWQEGDLYRDILEPGGNAGMIKVRYTGDYNPDGSPVRAVGAADRQIISADPDWLGGFNTRVAYKNWDLNVLGSYQHGGILVSSLHSSNGYLNLLTGRRGNTQVDYWTPENTGAKYPKPGGIQSGDNQKYGSTLGYFSGSYFKVGQITLGYNFDNNAGWFRKVGLNSVRLYFTIQNAFVLFSPFNNETGLDPVTNSHGNENAAVTSSLPYRAESMLTVGTNTPQTRNFIFGLNVSF